MFPVMKLIILIILWELLKVKISFELHVVEITNSNFKIYKKPPEEALLANQIRVNGACLPKNIAYFSPTFSTKNNHVGRIILDSWKTNMYLLYYVM